LLRRSINKKGLVTILLNSIFKFQINECQQISIVLEILPAREMRQDLNPGSVLEPNPLTAVQVNINPPPTPPCPPGGAQGGDWGGSDKIRDIYVMLRY
jgi:hypothetical protein